MGCLITQHAADICYIICYNRVVIKIANFFLNILDWFKAQLLKWRTFSKLSKWRTSFSAFSQNGEFSAFVIECLIRLPTEKLTFAFQSKLFSNVENEPSLWAELKVNDFKGNSTFFDNILPLFQK